jgi:hypothetical protein
MQVKISGIFGVFEGNFGGIKDPQQCWGLNHSDSFGVAETDLIYETG